MYNLLVTIIICVWYIFPRLGHNMSRQIFARLYNQPAFTVDKKKKEYK